MQQKRRTMSSKFQVDDIANTNVDHPQESLIAFFELALVKDLHSNDGRVLDGALRGSAVDCGGC